jgi:hypothetical protein
VTRAYPDTPSGSRSLRLADRPPNREDRRVLGAMPAGCYHSSGDSCIQLKASKDLYRHVMGRIASPRDRLEQPIHPLGQRSQHHPAPPRRVGVQPIEIIS